MTILCLFVRHGSTKYPDALAILDTWYQNQGLRSQRILWIIDNELPRETSPRQLAPDIMLRAGDNRAWEFSAWEQALREATAEGLSFDLIHCVTSAFHTLYTRYLDHFFPSAPSQVLQHNLCLGHIDSYERPVEFAGRVSRSWIRTCFFFLPYAVAVRMVSWAPFSKADPLFEHPTVTNFRVDAPLSVDYQRRIRIWLEGQTVGGHAWHSPVQTAPGEVTRFQLKTLAILNEHHLAITMRDMGLRLVDFCWLYTLNQEFPQLPLNPPEEQEQLKVRRRVLGIPEPLG